MLLLALAGLGAGCSDDEATGGNTGGNTTGRSELQIVLSGTGESESYKTKAIATESENKIDALQIYLFASESENGTYYYLETWNAGETAFNPEDEDPTTGKPVTKFKITDAGTSKKATLYPNELAGLPFIKLYCIANQNVEGVLASDGATVTKTTDDKFYKEDGKATVDALKAVTSKLNANGGYDITPGTTETDFCSIFTKALGEEVADGVISTPLVMTGSGKTKISGSVSKVNIDLRRIVARFDIDNTTSKSNLTIKKVQIAQGRKTAMLWDAKTTKTALSPVDKDHLTSDDKILQKSVAIDFDKLEGANEGVTKSSIYVYPTLATDESYLILEGTYKSPTTSQQVPVTYHVPIAHTPDNADKGQPIAIEANNRYCLSIKDVTQSNVFGTFEVVDWTSAGGITIRPDNDAPVFDSENAAIFSGNIPKNLNDGNPEATTFDYEVTGDTDGAGSFSVQIAATGKVRYETEVANTTKSETDWLTIQTSATEERDGVYYTTFDFSYSNSIGQQPVAVHFINEAASYDPDLWTTVNFYGPKAVPSFANVTDGSSVGNKTDVTDPKKPAATLFAVNNSFVTFDITSIEGVKVALPILEGYKVEEVASKGFVHTYKISVINESTATDGAIVFENAGDDTKRTTLTITKADPSLTFEEVTNQQSAVTYVTGTENPFVTTGKLNIDLDALTSGYSFKVKAPAGLTAPTFTSTWLNIAVDRGTWSEEDPYFQYTLTKKDGATTFDDFTMSFTNAIKGTDITGPGLTLTVHKDYEKPKFAAGATTDQWSKFNTDFAVDASFNDPTAATISMYKIDGSKITVNLNCNEAASFEALTGLTVEKIGTTNEYTITVTDATQLSTPTSELIAHNDGAYDINISTDRKAKLTITWVDPAITVEALSTGSETPTVTGLNVQVSNGFTKFNSVAFNIKGHKGSTIEYSETANKWATFPEGPTEIGDNGLAEVTVLGSANTSDISTLTITVHNAVTDKNEEITVNKAAN